MHWDYSLSSAPFVSEFILELMIEFMRFEQRRAGAELDNIYRGILELTMIQIKFNQKAETTVSYDQTMIGM